MQKQKDVLAEKTWLFCNKQNYLLAKHLVSRVIIKKAVTKIKIFKGYTRMSNWIISSSVAVLLLVLVVIVVVRKKFTQNSQNAVKELQGSSNTEKVTTLSLVDVLSFFKQPEILKRLQASQDLIAVAIKKTQEDGTFSIIMCLYSKESSIVAEPLKYFIAESLSEDLSSVFGSKDMIVLQ